MHHRWKALCFLLAALGSGYWFRFHAPAPEWLRDASGGAIYVVAWALGFALIWPKGSPGRQAAAALAVTCAIEVLQLWHPSWLQAVRATRPGRLVLGTHFSWWDFPPYFAGGAIAWALLKVMRMFR